MTITVVIPAQACGLIIGKGGERINALREQCQAKIQLQSKDRAIQVGYPSLRVPCTMSS